MNNFSDKVETISSDGNIILIEDCYKSNGLVLHRSLWKMFPKSFREEDKLFVITDIKSGKFLYEMSYVCDEKTALKFFNLFIKLSNDAGLKLGMDESYYFDNKDEFLKVIAKMDEKRKIYLSRLWNK